MQENQPWYWPDPCALERVLVTCFRSRHFLLRTASLFTASGWRVFTVRTRKQMSSTASHKRAQWWNKYHTVWPALRDLQLLPGVLSGALESVRVDSRWFDGKTRLPASFGCLEELVVFLAFGTSAIRKFGCQKFDAKASCFKPPPHWQSTSASSDLAISAMSWYKCCQRRFNIWQKASIVLIEPTACWPFLSWFSKVDSTLTRQWLRKQLAGCCSAEAEHDRHWRQALTVYLCIQLARLGKHLNLVDAPNCFRCNCCEGWRRPTSKKHTRGVKANSFELGPNVHPHQEA